MISFPGDRYKKFPFFRGLIQNEIVKRRMRVKQQHLRSTNSVSIILCFFRTSFTKKNIIPRVRKEVTISMSLSGHRLKLIERTKCGFLKTKITTGLIATGLIELQ